MDEHPQNIEGTITFGNKPRKLESDNI